MTMTRLVSMPMSRAVSGSWAVARMALPVFVFRTKACSATMATMAVTTTNTDTQAMRTPPTSKAPVVITVGNGWGRLPDEDPDQLLEADRNPDGRDQGGQAARCAAGGRPAAP